MKIKDRLSLYFSLLTSGLLLLVMTVIYFAFKRSMEHDFYKRLHERTTIIAGLYLEADEVSPTVLEGLRRKVLQIIPGEVYRIYNEQDEAVFVPDTQQYWSRSLVRETRQKEYLAYKEGKRQVVGRVYHDNQGSFVVISSAVDEGTFQRLNKLLRIMLAVFLAVVFITYYSGRVLAEKLLSPIEKLVGRMKVISASNLDMRVETDGKKNEISALAESFNNLLQRLEQSFTLQGTFVANVTHELRTPVTSIIGETEVALKQNRTADEYRDTLRSVLSDSVRLKETISGLLELAQVNSDFSHAPLTPVRVDELLWELHDYWSSTLGPGCLKMQFGELPEDEKALVVEGNKQLLYIALNNIIGNAFKFSDGQTVSCSLQTGSEGLKVEIRDQGKGIDAGEFQKVFDPFYRSASASEFAGTGMGLYIAVRIVTLFGGKLSVSESDSTGTAILVTLPSVISLQDS